MSNISSMNVFVECHNSPCIHVCDQKQKESNACRMGSALTYRRGELVTHNNGVGEINTQHREKESRGVEQRDRKKE